MDRENRIIFERENNLRDIIVHKNVHNTVIIFWELIRELIQKWTSK